MQYNFISNEVNEIRELKIQIESQRVSIECRMEMDFFGDNNQCKPEGCELMLLCVRNHFPF